MSTALVPYKRLCRLDGMELRLVVWGAVWWWKCDRCGRTTPNIVPEHAPSPPRHVILSRYVY